MAGGLHRPSNDDDDANLSRSPAERFTSSLCTKVEVDALCEKHGVPREFAAQAVNYLGQELYSRKASSWRR